MQVYIDGDNTIHSESDDVVSVVNEERSSSIPLDIFDLRKWENLDLKWKDQ